MKRHDGGLRVSFACQSGGERFSIQKPYTVQGCIVKRVQATLLLAMFAAAGCSAAHQNVMLAPQGSSQLLGAQQRSAAASRILANSAKSPDAIFTEQKAAGARIFKVKSVTIIDPVKRQSWVVPASTVTRAGSRLSVSTGRSTIQLDSTAQLLPGFRYVYQYRRGRESDPPTSADVERVQ